MHLRLLCLAILLVQIASASAQNRPAQTPTLLLGPADWSFERLSIPPGFARDIKWRGFEEARFAPGMFNTSASNYFTYTLVVSLEAPGEIDAAGLKEFLEKYYRGLSAGVGQRKQLKPEVNEIKAEVTVPKADPAVKNRFEGTMPFFDTFNDGRKITLHFEIAVVPKSATGKTYLTFLISPQPRDSAVWTNLRATIKDLKLEEK